MIYHLRDPGKPMVSFKGTSRKANGEVLVRFTEGQRTRSAKGRENQYHRLAVSRTNSTFFYLFVPFRLSMDWIMPAHPGEAHFPYLVHQFRG